ncbi:MAG: hypothetical protein GY869_20755 [Planctomycetes bacterium]|nr:hypothetical protein [Planctomycetota bacterium]
MKPLTQKQEQVLDFVGQYSQEQGFPPTMREIGQAIDLPNISAVRGHLAALEKKGYINKDPDKARSIRIIHSPSLLSRFKRKLHEFAKTDKGVYHRVVYGLVLVTYRKKPYLVGEQRKWFEAALERRTVEHGWTIVKKRFGRDHIVMMVEVWPNHSPELVAARIRETGNRLRRKHPKIFSSNSFWARGYAITTDLDRLDEIAQHYLAEIQVED